MMLQVQMYESEHGVSSSQKNSDFVPRVHEFAFFTVQKYNNNQLTK